MLRAAAKRGAGTLAVMTIAGDVDLAAVGTMLAEPARARILLALGGGLLRVEQQGRHRYYRLAGEEVGELIEAVSRVAPAEPVRSLRQGTRAEALRRARTCYDHLAGRLGVAVFAVLLERDAIAGG